MSIDSTISIKLTNKISAVEIIKSLMTYGWTLNDYGKVSYLPLGDNDDFNWQSENISIDTLFDIVRNKELLGELDASWSIEKISDYDWEYIDEIDFDISNLVNFFSNGMGEYIVVDIKKGSTDSVFLWSKRSLPEGDLNFWDVVDEWIVIGLEF